MEMMARHKKIGMGLLGLSLFSTLCLSVYAQSPERAKGEPVLLKGHARISTEQPASEPMNATHVMEIDREERALGGDQDLSSAPVRQLPAQKFTFFLDNAGLQDNLHLSIGYMRGLNTPEAHEEGQSHTDFVSSPSVIMVNGVRLQYIYTAGEMIKVNIPKSLLRPDGFNVVQVEAGYYFLPGNRVAYDQVRFQHLAINY
jgi:hypothetical protein